MVSNASSRAALWKLGEGCTALLADKLVETFLYSIIRRTGLIDGSLRNRVASEVIVDWPLVSNGTVGVAHGGEVVAVIIAHGCVRLAEVGKSLIPFAAAGAVVLDLCDGADGDGGDPDGAAELLDRSRSPLGW